MKHYLVAINAKYIHSNLAVYSLKACAGEFKDSVEIGEFTINNQKDYILEQIYKANPDVLYFSCYIWNISYVEDIAKEYRKLCPDVPIWVGGPEVSYEVETFLKNHPYIDGVMIAEGEETFYETLRFYENLQKKHKAMKRANLLEEIKYEDVAQIAGIAFRKDDQVIFTKERGMMDMNKIPFAYNKMEDFSNRIIYYESSRGCPFSCSYCLSSIDKKLRFRDVEIVKQELQFFIDQNVPQIKFVDRTFNCYHEHAMEIWKYIKAHDNGVTNFHFEISADLINEEELEIMSDMRPGLIQLEIGVQSTNQVTIEEIHRTMKLDRLKEVVRTIQSYENIHEHLDLIAGLPYEDYATFTKSFDEIYALKPNQLQLGFLKVLKGSYMYDHAKEYGILYHDDPPYEVLSTNWLSFADVLRIKQVEETLEVYYNSGQFEITMKVLEKYFDSAFDLYQSLGQFYERKGYFGMSHSRNRRAEILLEFMEEKLSRFANGNSLADKCESNKKEKVVNSECMEYDWEKEKALLQEATLYDLYYRENCKSRPAWAKDQSMWKRETHAICENGKLSHLEPFHYAFPAKGEKTLQALPVPQEKEIWVLFDYAKRDPLDHQASISDVTQQVEAFRKEMEERKHE